jgi:hypothetical protein
MLLNLTFPQNRVKLGISLENYLFFSVESSVVKSREISIPGKVMVLYVKWSTNRRFVSFQ